MLRNSCVSDSETLVASTVHGFIVFPGDSFLVDIAAISILIFSARKMASRRNTRRYKVRGEKKKTSESLGGLKELSLTTRSEKLSRRNSNSSSLSKACRKRSVVRSRETCMKAYSRRMKKEREKNKKGRE